MNNLLGISNQALAEMLDFYVLVLFLTKDEPLLTRDYDFASGEIEKINNILFPKIYRLVYY